jgi:murein L,D-transpeptidase YafK
MKTKGFKKCIFRFLLVVVISLLIFYFFPESSLPKNTMIDSLKVCKSEKRMYAYSNGKIIKTYKISFGKNHIGKKEFEGDNKTPEGNYIINDKNPNSGYHKNLGISYPNNSDIENAKRLGKRNGGDIKIHGLKNGLGKFDKFHYWFSTRGCIRVTNNEVDELFNAVSIGTPIEIKP